MPPLRHFRFICHDAVRCHFRRHAIILICLAADCQPLFRPDAAAAFSYYAMPYADAFDY